MRRLILFATIVTACFVGGGVAAKGFWIYLKAQTAQFLIERAWNDNQSAESQLAPWPWADTHVIARMRVPAAGIKQYVLAGAHGQALAFGPGHLTGTSLPGESGNSVIAGHRDTHFQFLRRLEPGDEIFFDTADGRTIRYRVNKVWVTNDTDMRPLQESADVQLTLITCFPFDAMRAGGSLRFIVEATA